MENEELITTKAKNIRIATAAIASLKAARNYIKLLEMKGAGPIAVGLVKANYQEKEKAMRNVQVCIFAG